MEKEMNVETKAMKVVPNPGWYGWVQDGDKKVGVLVSELMTAGEMRKYGTADIPAEISDSTVMLQLISGRLGHREDMSCLPSQFTPDPKALFLIGSCTFEGELEDEIAALRMKMITEGWVPDAETTRDMPKFERCTFGFAALSNRTWPVIIDHICETGKLAGKLVVRHTSSAGKDCAELIDSSKFTPSRDAAKDFWRDGGWDFVWDEVNERYRDEWGESKPIWAGDSARCLNFWPEEKGCDYNSPTNITSDVRALREHWTLVTSESGLTQSEIDEIMLTLEFSGKVLDKVEVGQVLNHILYVRFTDGSAFGVSPHLLAYCPPKPANETAAEPQSAW